MERLSTLRTGDAVECRVLRKGLREGFEYVRGRVVNVDQQKGKLMVSVRVLEQGDGPVRVERQWVLRQGQAADIWERVRQSLRSAVSRGMDVQAVFLQHLGEDYSTVLQFCNAIQAIEGGDARLIHQDLMRQVLWRKGFLDSKDMMIIHRKLIQDPEFMDFSATRNRLNDDDADLKRVFKNFEPIRIMNVVHAIESFKGTSLTPRERKLTMEYVREKGMGPRSICTIVEFTEMLGKCGLRHGREVYEGSLLVDDIERVRKEICRVMDTLHSQGLDCREVFEAFDTNFDGIISIGEFKRGMNLLGINLDQGLLEELLKRRGEFLRKNKIEYKQFLAILAPNSWQVKVSSEDLRCNHVALAAFSKLQDILEIAAKSGVTLKDSFEHFDLDGNGLIDRKEFLKGLKKLGISLRPEEVRILMRMFEAEDSVGVDYMAFVAELTNPKNSPCFRSEVGDKVKEVLQSIWSAGGDVRLLFEDLDTTYSSFLSFNDVLDLLFKNGLKMEKDEASINSIFDCFSKAGLIRDDDVDKRVDYANLICIWCPDAWFGSSQSTEHRQQVDDVFDSLCEILSEAEARGISLNESFKHFDVNGSGFLSAPEFHQGLRRMGTDIEPRAVRLLMRDFEGKLSNYISLKEFEKVLRRRIDRKEHFRAAIADVSKSKGLQGIEEAFKRHDHVKNGAVGFNAACLALGDLGIPISQRELRLSVDSSLLSEDRSLLKYNLLSKWAKGEGKLNPCESRSEKPRPQCSEEHSEREEPINAILSNLRQLVDIAEQRGVSLQESFRHFDVMNEGSIGVSEFIDGVRRLGLHLTEWETQAIVTCFQLPGKQRIDLPRFFEMLGRKDRPKLEHTYDSFLILFRKHILDAIKERGMNLRSCFEHFDVDKTCSIDERALATGLERLGVNGPPRHLKRIVSEFGVNGKLSYSGFARLAGSEELEVKSTRILKQIQLMLAVRRVSSQTSQSALRSLFAKYDENRDGIISRNDFLAVLYSFQLSFGDEGYELLLRRFDPNSDSLIDYMAFIDSVEPSDSTQHLLSSVEKILKHLRVEKISKCAREYLLKAFRLFDFSDLGVITEREFRTGLKSMGFDLRDLEMKALTEVLQLNNDGKIHYRILTRIWNDWAAGNRILDEEELEPFNSVEDDLADFIASAELIQVPLRETFLHFDKNHDGTVTWDEFQTAMMELGFECSQEELRALMKRIQGEARSDIARPVIEYDRFLKFFSDKRRMNHFSNVSRSEKMLQREALQLQKDLRQLLLDGERNGVAVSEIFRRFDENLDGYLSLTELKTAVSQAFAQKNKAYDDVVLDRLLVDLDENKDGKVDYFDLLGISRKSILRFGAEAKEAGTWTSAFASRRLNKKRHEAKSAAKAVMHTILLKMENEVYDKGPIFHAVRNEFNAKRNSASFVQRNKIVVSTKAPLIDERNLDDKKDKAKQEESGVRSMLAKAERIHDAETAAARIAAQVLLKEKRLAALKQREAEMEHAKNFALGRIGEIFFFTSKKRASSFLESIGLGRFCDRLTATVSRGVQGCYVFPLSNDHDMQQILGSTSTIIARKVRREILNLLSRKYGGEFEIDEEDPQHWSATTIARFATCCGFGDVSIFLKHEIDGAAVLELDPPEAIVELGCDDEIAAQRLLYQTSFMHFFAQDKNSSLFYEAKFENGSVLGKPALEEWSVAEVQSFLRSLGLDDAANRAEALAIDGEILAELTEVEMQKELHLSEPDVLLLEERINASKRPPWLSLGTGPYFDLRLEVASDLHHHRQNLRNKCLILETSEDHHFEARLGPALQKALKICVRAQATASFGRTIGPKEDTSLENDRLSEARLCDERDKLMTFIAHAAHGGMKVMQHFERVSQSDNGFARSILLADFEESLQSLGFKIKDLSLFRIMLQEKLSDHLRGPQILLQSFLVACLNHAEYHRPRFSAEKSSDMLAFTKDGFGVSLLLARESEKMKNESVMVRYGNGCTLYEATLHARYEDGSFEVCYSDSGTFERVPAEWVVSGWQSGPLTKSNRSDFQLACAETGFQAGVHIWKVRLNRVVNEVTVGICSSRPGRRGWKFLGLSSTGSLIVKCSSKESSMKANRVLNAGMEVFIKVDFKASEVQFRAKKAEDMTVSSFGDLEILGKLALTGSRERTDEEISHLPLFRIELFIRSCTESIRSRFASKGFVPANLLMEHLLEAGLEEEREQIVFDALRPFVNNRKGGVDVLRLLKHTQEAVTSEMDDSMVFTPAMLLSSSGDSVMFVPPSFSDADERPAKLQPGTKVEVRFGGGASWYKATLVEDLNDDRYTVRYDDEEGGELERNVHLDNIRIVERIATASREEGENLQIRLFARLLAYNLTDSEKRPEKKKKKNETRSWTLGRNYKLAFAQREEDQKQVFAKTRQSQSHVLPKTTVEPQGSSFTSLSSVRVKNLLQRRLNNPDPVAWSLTEKTKYCLFAPMTDRTRSTEDVSLEAKGGWIPVATLNLNSMEESFLGEKGFPFSVSIEENDSEEIYYRICLMGCLGRLDQSGNFEPLTALVDPLKAVIEQSRLRVGGGWDYEGSIFPGQQHQADRFYLVSGAFALRNYNATCSFENVATTAIKRKGVKTRMSEFGKGSRTRTRTPKKWLVEPKESRKQKDWQNNQFLGRNKSQANLSFSQDERIVIDRWLKIAGLNQFGEPHDAESIKIEHAPPRDLQNRLSYIQWIHTSRPWMQFGREHSWLPGKEEHRQIRKWARKNELAAPSRVSSNQTSFEALLQVFPDKPWRKGLLRQVSQRKVHSSFVAPKGNARALQRSKRVAESKLEEFDQDLEKLHRIKAELEMKGEGSDHLSQNGVKDAISKVNEMAQLEWEKRQDREQLERIGIQQQQNQLRQKELEELEKRLQEEARAYHWGQNIEERFSPQNKSK